MSAFSQDISILDIIRSKLWNGHACVMVGSGFSRNADHGDTLPPTWGELAFHLASELYCQCPQDNLKDIVAQKNALQLAQEYETLLGRSALNDFIKRNIGDDTLMPTTLFAQFLELPWNDVFTTNYDTLLERAAKGVWGRKYDLVCSCQDLALAETPRIIKLHGTITSLASPLIVTEEDYRTYPRKFAPFVNTVQQALMESSLCLVGFSGTDPNFLSWLGWVRDNLGNAMPQVYLLSVSAVPEVERQVFRDKNVIVVDLSCLDKKGDVGVTGRIGNLLAFLKGEPENNGKWQAKMLVKKWGEHARMPTPEGIQDMETRRKAYPRWVVMPPEQRDALCFWEDIEVFAIAGLEQLASPWDLKGLYEFNWCREKCLLPLLDIGVYQSILEKYKLSLFGEGPFAEDDVLLGEMRQKWLDLAFAVYRFHREKGQTEEWKKWDETLDNLVQGDGDRLNRLAYERVMMGFVQIDIKQVSDAMSRWDELERSPYWTVKHATLLFELGKVEKGVSELENTLNRIRPLIPKGRIKNDYELLSLEGVILGALSMVHPRNMHPSGQSQKILQRLQELAAFQCNPFEEASRFEALMSSQEPPEVGQFTRRNFDVTNTSIKQKRGLLSSVKNAFQCARFFEDSGLPLYVDFCINSLTSALPGCASRLAPVAPDWAFSLFCRLGAKGDIDEELFFSQRHIALTPVEEINQRAAVFIQRIKDLLEEYPDFQTKTARSYHPTAIKVLLEILSRLSFKVSDQVLEDIFDIGVMVTKSMASGVNIVVGDLFRKFFWRVIRSMNGALLFKKLPDLLYLASPVVAQRHSPEWVNLFLSINWHGFKVSPRDCSSKLLGLIDGVIDQVKSGQRQTRGHAFVVIDRLRDLGILSSQQLSQFGKNILLHMGKSGLPDFSVVLPHGYLLYLAPVLERSLIESRVLSNYLEFDFEVHMRTETGWTFEDNHFEHVVGSMLETLSVLATRPERKMSLNNTDAGHLFHAFVAGLNATMKEVQEAPEPTFFPGHSARDVFIEAIGLYDRVLGEIIVPHIDDKTLTEAKTWFTSMSKQLLLPVSDLALHGGEQEQLDRIALEIRGALSLENEDAFKSFLQAYSNWCRLASKGELAAPPQEILRGLIDAVSMRGGEYFKGACSVLGQIVGVVKFAQDDTTILMESLNQLAEQTTFASSSSRFPVEERIDFRVVSARLAGLLYKWHEDSGQTIPTALMKWKAIGEDPEELRRVRTAWKDALLAKA